MIDIAWSPDSTKIADVENHKGVEIWDVYSGTLQRNFHIEREVATAAWSPDGARIVTVGDLGFACPGCDMNWNPQIWDPNGNLETTLEGHSAYVTSAKWSPNGKELATSDLGSRIIIWDMISNKQIYTFGGGLPEYNGTGSLSNAMDWSPDSKYLAITTDTGHLQIWNLRDHLLQADISPADLNKSPSLF